MPNRSSRVARARPPSQPFDLFVSRLKALAGVSGYIVGTLGLLMLLGVYVYTTIVSPTHSGQTSVQLVSACIALIGANVFVQAKE